MLLRCVLTVFTEMYISVAISAVLSMPDRCRSTSLSRSLSCSTITGTAWAVSYRRTGGQLLVIRPGSRLAPGRTASGAARVYLAATLARVTGGLVLRPRRRNRAGHPSAIPPVAPARTAGRDWPPRLPARARQSDDHRRPAARARARRPHPARTGARRARPRQRLTG